MPTDLSTTRRVRVHPAIAERFPAARIAVVYGFDLVNAPSSAADAERLRQACRQAAQILGTQKPRSHPHIQAWRAVYQAFGAKPSKYICSAEALIQRSLKDAPPSINRLVDFYNAVSIANFLPIGSEDLDCLQGDLVLQHADGKMSFDIADAEGAGLPIVPEGEVVWADDGGVTCRRWNWRQGRRTRLTETSHNAYFILEALSPPYESGAFDQAVEAIARGLGPLAGASRVVVDRLR